MRISDWFRRVLFRSHDDRQPLGSGLKALKLAAPCGEGAGGQLHIGDLRLGFRDESAKTAAAHIGLDDDHPLTVLAADLVEPLGVSEARHFAERDGTRVPGTVGW